MSGILVFYSGNADRFYLIGKGWIRKSENEILYKILISVIIMFLFIPVVIGLLVLLRIIPFKISINHVTYSGNTTSD